MKAASSVDSVLTLNLNVTVVNTAPFPKFLVLNPSYVITVYRLNDNETTSELVSNPRLQLNGNPGIWLMPYEKVVINLVSVRTQTYSLPQVSCGGEGDGSNLACGSVVPPLVNSPYSLSARSIFPVLDGYIKILGYGGKITFVVTPTDNSPTFFAVTLPVVFSDGEISDMDPSPTMTYDEYKDMLYEYSGFQRKIRGPVQVMNTSSNLFQLTPKLLTGVQISVPTVDFETSMDYELPVWIVYSTGGSIEISYNVKWSVGGG
ncbi:hypothetical protein [Thermococcus peptonophilus]|uniref:hypothetical protein n=1 Tax=Thermococcus peptonophilus TaxID=53952 RepID=UPI0012E70CFA|nr:hypothetical protein [Thermococcus peptonophilus]